MNHMMSYGNRKEQVALCATADIDKRNELEKALLKEKIQYLLQCEKKARDKTVTFYIEQKELERARNVAEQLKIGLDMQER